MSTVSTVLLLIYILYILCKSFRFHILLHIFFSSDQIYNGKRIKLHEINSKISVVTLTRFHHRVHEKCQIFLGGHSAR